MSEDKKKVKNLSDTLLTDLHNLLDTFRESGITKSEVIGVVTMFKTDLLMEDYGPADLVLGNNSV